MAFTYDDKEPWPESADGDGYSLVAAEINPTGHPDNYRYWRASRYTGGSPFSDDVEHTLVDETAGESMEASIHVFPNPASETVTITHQNQFERSIVTISNLYGKTIYTGTITGSMQFNFKEYSLPSGMYLITISSSKGSYTKKIIYRPLSE
jgi:hypothetical protein